VKRVIGTTIIVVSMIFAACQTTDSLAKCSKPNDYGCKNWAPTPEYGAYTSYNGNAYTRQAGATPWGGFGHGFNW
jgi:hypothetical protein